MKQSDLVQNDLIFAGIPHVRNQNPHGPRVLVDSQDLPIIPGAVPNFAVRIIRKVLPPALGKVPRPPSAGVSLIRRLRKNAV